MIYSRIQSPTTWFHDSLKQMKHLQKLNSAADPSLKDAMMPRVQLVIGLLVAQLQNVFKDPSGKKTHHPQKSCCCLVRVADVYCIYIYRWCMYHTEYTICTHIYINDYMSIYVLYLKNKNQSSDWFKSTSALASRWFFDFRENVAMESHGIVSVSLLLAWLVNPFFRKYVLKYIHSQVRVLI